MEQSGEHMVEFVLMFLVVFLALAMMLAVIYQSFLRRNIVQRVREAGGELLLLRRMEGQPRPIGNTRRAQPALAPYRATYYVVKYRTGVGHELTRMCKLSPLGGVFWYDEE
jgi:hypothetical protein